MFHWKTAVNQNIIRLTYKVFLSHDSARLLARTQSVWKTKVRARKWPSRSWSSLAGWHKHTFQRLYVSEKLKHYPIILTLLLFVRWMWLSNTDEDDKEEERPEELDYQLDLWQQKTWLLWKIDETVCSKMSLMWELFIKINDLYSDPRTKHVSTLFLLRYVTFFQRRRRSCLKKSIAPRSYLTMMVSWKKKKLNEKIRKGSFQFRDTDHS